MPESRQETERERMVRIHIDGMPHESPSPTTGEALYKLGGVPPHHELYRETEGDREDAPITNGKEAVHLKHDERFHSGPIEIAIYVNGRKEKISKRLLTFDELVSLSKLPSGPNVLFTITYRNGPENHPEGSLTIGATIRIKRGMIFNVYSTTRS